MKSKPKPYISNAVLELTRLNYSKPIVEAFLKFSSTNVMEFEIAWKLFLEQRLKEAEEEEDEHKKISKR